MGKLDGENRKGIKEGGEKTFMGGGKKKLGDLKNKDNPVEIVYNDDWLSKLTFEEIIDISSNFTVQRMLERDMFEKRIKEQKPIYLHEFLYPLMQGYDSVERNNNR